jgi:hypothetical protein
VPRPWDQEPIRLDCIPPPSPIGNPLQAVPFPTALPFCGWRLRWCGGSEVRIISAASPKCGLLNQSYTRSINFSFDSDTGEPCRRG